MPLHATDHSAWFQRGKGGGAMAVSFCLVPKWATICPPALPWDFPQQVYPLLGSLDWLWLTPVVWMMDTCHVDYNMARIFFSFPVLSCVTMDYAGRWQLSPLQVLTVPSLPSLTFIPVWTFRAMTVFSPSMPPASAVLWSLSRCPTYTVTDHLRHQGRKGTVSVSLGFRCLF